jgi:uncharacterized protein (TIGR03435 family)
MFSYAAIVMFLLALPTVSMEIQTGDPEKPRFEIVSIKPTPPNNHETDHKFLPGGRFKARAPVGILISEAYGIDFLQVLNVPNAMANTHWDIEARPEEGKYPLKNGLLDPQVGNLMIQTMLEDRFKLKMHRETRTLPGYELVIAKGGPRMEKISGEPKRPRGGMFMPGHFEISSQPISDLASALSRVLLLFEGEKSRFHVVDKTGLEGLYDIKLRWTPDLSKAPGFPKEEADQSGITLFDAIQDQLGLKLVPAKIPTPVVVVDEVQMPTTN